MKQGLWDYTHLDYVHRDTVNPIFFFLLFLINTAKPETLIQMSIEKPGKKNQSYSPVLLCYVWSCYTFNHGMIIETHFSNPKK